MWPSTKLSGRFEFGKNWQRFVGLVDDKRISAAEGSLQSMLGTEQLTGRRFLDIGSGSGLFSLAARNLGASVVSFDYDQQSVACTCELRNCYYNGGTDWLIERGDVLDADYIESLGRFDVVYSWGVLHHTGDMWTSLRHAASCVDDGGKIFVAIYNDQRWLSRYWLRVKRLYNEGMLFRWLVIATHAPIFIARQVAKLVVTGTWGRPRGMSPWRDIIDWLGGYPFEVAKPEEIVEFFKKQGFLLDTMTTVGGRQGCNQFVLRRHACPEHTRNA